MSVFLIFICLVISISSSCQHPNFISNAKKQDTLNREIPIEVLKGFEFVISYTADSYWWVNEKKFWILALKNKKWVLIKYEKIFQKGTVYPYDTTKPPKVSVSQHRISKNKIRRLLNVFDHQRLWTLNSDSLNINEKKRKDSTSLYIGFTDGVEYKFELITTAKHRVVSAYEPHRYLKMIPEITVRQNFIICLETFLDLIKKYRG